ncbi:hypothetical protein [Parasitella parasitica]|uniref:Uncharacterized protein n=1 Tax=Parasitella parasitica TaxID=35722 RepID=A0A0B7NMV6_9FUNG|nr:hypothetical protein [Parasitella parasitica]
MSESKIKRLWKNRISQQLNSFSFSACIVPSNTDRVDHTDIPPAVPHHADITLPAEKKLWRKPLPVDCPSFDFQFSEKTMVEENEASLNTKKAEIPTRIQSRYYGNIPNLEAQLERACKNEKAVLLTKLLEQKRHGPCTL